MEEEFLLAAQSDDKKLAHQLIAQGGMPAFMVRAAIAQRAWKIVIDSCRAQRHDWLSLVGIRLATLLSLAGDWLRLGKWISEDEIAVLQELHRELSPQLRVKIAPSNSPRTLRNALLELGKSMQRFNRRWEKHLREIDLSAVNQLREKYNRYYILEKECIVGSPKLAKRGFEELPPCTTDDLLEMMPLLPTFSIQ